MTKIRGGSRALEQLLADLQVVEAALRDIKEYSTRPRLVEDMADDGLLAARTLRSLALDVIGPMLERRDRVGARDLDDLIDRIARVELWIAESERERRAERPYLREVKQERG